MKADIHIADRRSPDLQWRDSQGRIWQTTICGEWVLAEHLSVSDCDITCEWCALVNFANLLDSDPEAFCEPPNR